MLFWIIIYFNLGTILPVDELYDVLKDSEKIAQSWGSESTLPFLGLGGGLVVSSFHVIIVVRILECFANCQFFALKVVYFSNTIIHFISEGSENMWIWWEGDQKRWVTVHGAIFMIPEWLSFWNESCPYYFLFTRYWTLFHSCTSNSRMSSFQFSMTIFKWNYCSGMKIGNPSSRVRIIV